MLRIVFILSLFILYLSAESMVIDENFKSINSANFQKLFLDANNSLTPQDILYRIQTEEDKKLKHIGILQKVHWSRFDIFNNQETKAHIFLLNNLANVDYIDVYIFKEKELVAKHKLGFQRGFDEKMWTRNSQFTLDLSPYEKLTIVTRYESYTGGNSCWIALNEMEHTYKNSFEMLIIGLFSGMFVILGVYSTFLYISIKHKYLLPYIAMNISVFFWFFIYTGSVFLFDFNFNEYYVRLAMWSFLTLFTLSALSFIYFFTEIYKISRILTLIARIFMVLLLISATSVWLSHEIYTFMAKTNLVMFATIYPFLLIVILYTIYKKIPTMKYLLFAEISMMITILLVVLGLIGMVDLNDEFRYFGFLYGAIIHIALIALAINQRIKFIKDEFEKNQQLLLAQSKFIAAGQAVASISHQYKQPLSNISSSFILLESILEHDSQNLKEEVISLIPDIKFQINYLKNVVDDFFKFYTKEDSVDSIMLHQELERLITILQYDIKILGIKINIDVDKDSKIITNVSYFSQVIVSILQNSIDICKIEKIKDPTITIKYFNDSNCYKITIEDNCGGIKVKPIEKIFEPFFTTKVSKSNLGLGLYIIKQIVEQKLKGAISASNSKNGAIFTVEIKKN